MLPEDTARHPAGHGTPRAQRLLRGPRLSGQTSFPKRLSSFVSALWKDPLETSPGLDGPPPRSPPHESCTAIASLGALPGGPRPSPARGEGEGEGKVGGAGVRGERQGGGTGWSESSGGARGFQAGRSQGLSRARWLPVQCSLLASPAGKGESSAPRSAPQQHRLCLAPGRCLLSPRPSSVTPTLHPVHQQDAHCPASRCCRAHTSHLGRGSERAGVMVEHGVTRQLMTIGRGSRAPLHWLRTRCAHCRRMWLPGLRQPWDSGGRVV